MTCPRNMESDLKLSTIPMLKRDGFLSGCFRRSSQDHGAMDTPSDYNEVNNGVEIHFCTRYYARIRHRQEV